MLVTVGWWQHFQLHDDENAALAVFCVLGVLLLALGAVTGRYIYSVQRDSRERSCAHGSLTEEDFKDIEAKGMFTESDAMLAASQQDEDALQRRMSVEYDSGTMEYS